MLPLLGAFVFSVAYNQLQDPMSSCCNSHSSYSCLLYLYVTKLRDVRSCVWHYWYCIHEYQTFGIFRLCDVFRAFSFSVIMRAAANAMLPLRSVRRVRPRMPVPRPPPAARPPTRGRPYKWFAPHPSRQPRPKAEGRVASAAWQGQVGIFGRGGGTRLAEPFREMHVD